MYIGLAFAAPHFFFNNTKQHLILEGTIFEVKIIMKQMCFPVCFDSYDSNPGLEGQNSKHHAKRGQKVPRVTLPSLRAQTRQVTASRTVAPSGSPLTHSLSLFLLQ